MTSEFTAWPLMRTQRRRSWLLSGLSSMQVLESDGGNHRSLFLGPAAGGLKVDFNNNEVVVITPDSPLGRDLLGKEVGDVIEIKVEGSLIEYELLS